MLMFVVLLDFLFVSEIISLICKGREISNLIQGAYKTSLSELLMN